jgi:hypothetical protein
MDTVCSSETLVPTDKSIGVTTQKTNNDIFTAAKTSNLIKRKTVKGKKESNENKESWNERKEEKTDKTEGAKEEGREEREEPNRHKETRKRK